MFKNEELDFGFIDANHKFEAVTLDMNIWYPKIKMGGILAGHDYLSDGEYNHGLFQVQSVVDTFIRSTNEHLHICWEELWPTWYFIKSGGRDEQKSLLLSE